MNSKKISGNSHKTKDGPCTDRPVYKQIILCSVPVISWRALQFFKTYIGKIVPVFLPFGCRSVFQAILLYVVYDFLKPFGEFFKVLLIKENLVLVIREASVSLHLSLAFGDGEVIVIALRGLHIEEICAFACPYRL